ncbi:MAG: hypothetical protein AAGD38_01550 [Acidobacteriota bacterium]
MTKQYLYDERELLFDSLLLEHRIFAAIDHIEELTIENPRRAANFAEYIEPKLRMLQDRDEEAEASIALAAAYWFDGIRDRATFTLARAEKLATTPTTAAAIVGLLASNTLNNSGRSTEQELCEAERHIDHMEKILAEIDVKIVQSALSMEAKLLRSLVIRLRGDIPAAAQSLVDTFTTIRAQNAPPIEKLVDRSARFQRRAERYRHSAVLNLVLLSAEFPDQIDVGSVLGLRFIRPSRKHGTSRSEAMLSWAYGRARASEGDRRGARKHFTDALDGLMAMGSVRDAAFVALDMVAVHRSHQRTPVEDAIARLAADDNQPASARAAARRFLECQDADAAQALARTIRFPSLVLC